MVERPEAADFNSAFTKSKPFEQEYKDKANEFIGIKDSDGNLTDVFAEDYDLSGLGTKYMDVVDIARKGLYDISADSQKVQRDLLESFETTHLSKKLYNNWLNVVDYENFNDRKFHEIYRFLNNNYCLPIPLGPILLPILILKNENLSDLNDHHQIIEKTNSIFDNKKIANNKEIYMETIINLSYNKKYIKFICKKCNVFYIGETSQTIRNRMNNHFHTLRNSNFKTNDQAKMVIPDHFKLLDHDYETHFSFTIIKQGLSDSRYRFGFEQEFIHFFKANHRILNINIPTLRTKSIFNLFSND
jgi:RNase P subunit RPR2